MKLSTVVLLFMAADAACDAGKKPAPTAGSGSVVAPVVASVSLADAQPGDAPIVADAGALPGDALPDVPCTTADIKRVRKDADALVKAGHADQAVAQLHAIQCWLQDGQAADLQDQIAWHISDLAFAQYKAGQFEECYDTAESQTEPYPHNVAEVLGDDSKIVQALAYNSELCHMAADKKRGAFIDSTECFDGDSTSKGLPEDVYRAKSPACIVIGEPTKNSDGDAECGKVYLQVKGQKRKRLTIDGEYSNLSDPGVCCNISDVKFAARLKGFAMLVLSGGRNCDGGTASTSEEHVYQLDGTTLRVVSRLDAHYH